MPDNTGGQFPSLDGDPEAEVAQRTEADTDGSWFRHVFTLHNRAHTVGLPDDHEIHRANFVAVLQRALQQGLHPKAQPELESEEPCPSDPVNHTNVTYRVKVVPAVADTDPLSTVTPSNPNGDPDRVDGAPYPEPGEVDPRWLAGETGEPPSPDDPDDPEETPGASGEVVEPDAHAGGGGVDTPAEAPEVVPNHTPGADHDHSDEAEAPQVTAEG